MGNIDKRCHFLLIIFSLVGGTSCAFSVASHFLRLWQRSLPVQIGLLLLLTLCFGSLIYIVVRLRMKNLLASSGRNLILNAVFGFCVALFVYGLLINPVQREAWLRSFPPTSHDLVIIIDHSQDNSLSVGLVELIEVKVAGEKQILSDFTKTGEWDEGVYSVNAKISKTLSTTGPATLNYRFIAQADQPVQLIFIEGPDRGGATVRLDNEVIKFNLTDYSQGETTLTLHTSSIGSILIALECVDILALAFLVITITDVSLINGIIYKKLSLINRKRYQTFLFSLTFFIFVLIIRHMDLPERMFYYSGLVIPIYSAARLVIMVYLAIIFYSLGKHIIQWIKIQPDLIHTVDFFILYCFLGGSALNLFMFFIGMVNGYYLWIALIVTIPLVYLSYPDAREFYSKGKHHFLQWITEMISSIRSLKTQAISTSLNKMLYGILIITAIIEGIVLLIVHGLSPDNEFDVATHYMPYYEAVIRNHGIFPNNVWYHFFYNKANGLFFLSNLLTDKYGAQLISFIYVVFTTLILYSILKNISENRSLRWFILIQFLSILWTSSGSITNLVAFSKLHIIEMSIMAFSIWVSIKIATTHLGKDKIFSILYGSVLIGLFVFSPKSVIFLLPYFFVVILWFLFAKKADESKNATIIFLMLLATQAGMMTYNYFATGMFDDIPIRIMWNFANQHIFSKWVSPYLMLYLLEGSAPHYGTFLFNIPPFEWYIGALRLDRILFFHFPWDWTDWLLLSVIVFGLSICAVIALLKHKIHFQNKSLWFFLTGIVILEAVLLPIVFNQWISLDRTYIFTIFFMLLLLVILWEMGPAIILKHTTSNRILNILITIGWVLIVVDVNRGLLPIFLDGNQAGRMLRNPIILRASNFVTGGLSYAEYNQTGIDDRDYYDAHQFAGNDQRILSLNYSSTLPGRNIEREIDYAYREWHVMAFDEPEEAKQAFQIEGINYFLLSADRNKRLVIGAFPYSPLFHPDHIKKNFDVIWKSEDTYLITWKGTHPQPLPWDNKFVDTYKIKLAEEGLPDLYERVDFYYQKYATDYPIYPDRTLEPVKGWQ